MNNINLSYECFNGFTINCYNTRLALIKAQLAAGALMATTCFIYLLIYGLVVARVSQVKRHRVSSAGDPVMTPVYPAPLTSVVNYQHQPYMSSPHGYQSSAPVMMPAYQQLPPVNTNGNYPTMYPQIPSDRF
jgi:hypothetical protein